MRIALLLIFAALSVTGCATTVTQSPNASTQPAALAGYQVDPVQFGPNQTIWAALFAFREGRGEWPASPEELCPSSYMQALLGLPYYDGLKFTRLPDGRLDFYYKQLRNPLSGVTAGAYHTVLSYPPAQ